MRRTLPLLSALTLLSLAGCQVEGTLGAHQILDLRRAERLWHRQGLLDYDFVYRKACFCDDVAAVRIHVRGGAVVGATRVADGRDVPPSGLDGLPTVDDLFSLARHALTEADRVQVSYDAVRGYPTTIDIDWYAEAVDDEITHVAESLQPAY